MDHATSAPVLPAFVSFPPFRGLRLLVRLVTLMLLALGVAIRQKMTVKARLKLVLSMHHQKVPRAKENLLMLEILKAAWLMIPGSKSSLKLCGPVLKLRCGQSIQWYSSRYCQRWHCSY